MADTFVKIASVAVGVGGAASMAFTSIPSTYTDLCVKLSARSSRADDTVDALLVRFNGDTGANYSNRELIGNGTTTGSVTLVRAGLINSVTSTSNTFSSNDIYVPNYTGSTNKSVSADGVTEQNGTTALQAFNAYLWSNTAAITSLTLVPNLGTLFLQYSTATLYGILKA
jgi:hypothetical protein